MNPRATTEAVPEEEAPAPVEEYVEEEPAEMTKTMTTTSMRCLLEFGGSHMARDDDGTSWPVVLARDVTKEKRQHRSKAERLDHEHQRAEQNEFSWFDDRQGQEWMKEERYNTMFRDIEAKIQAPWERGHDC